MTDLMHASRGRVPWLRVAVGGAVSVMLAASLPLLWAAVQGGASVLILGSLLAIGWASLRALPYFGQWLENRILNARLAEARANPLAELIHQLTTRTRQLERYRAALVEIAAQIQIMRDMLEERRASAPQDDTEKQAAALRKMVVFHACHVQKLAAAELTLEEFKRHLTAKRFEWNFAQAGRQVLESLRVTNQESLVRELLCDEATRSVQASLARVFASLEVELQVVERLAPNSAAPWQAAERAQS